MNRDAKAHILSAIDILSPDIDDTEEALLMLEEVLDQLTQAQAILEYDGLDTPPQPKKKKARRKKS